MLSISTRPTNFKTGKAKKLAQFHKRARAQVKGFIIYWTDKHPFGPGSVVENISVDHTNPTQRLIVADMWNQCEKWIMETEFQWEITMRLIFENCNGDPVIREAELALTCPLRGKKAKMLNDAMQYEFESFMRENSDLEDSDEEKGVFSGCVFVAKIAGV